MRFFFRSRQFKIILTVVIILLALSVCFTIIGNKISPQANLFGTITAPFREAAVKISQGVKDFISAYSDGNEIMLKNEELEEEINKLRNEIKDYDEIVAENEFYKDYLEIKEKNTDFKFLQATLISRDNSDPYGSFVINKGTYNGVNERDPVITDAGLVGYISQAGLTTSKVSTILSPDITLGALDNRTNDSGVVSGSLDLAEKGQTKLYNLSRSCNVAIGDYVVTSGEGIFPSGLLVGTIKNINTDKYNTSIYASIEPFADIQNIRDVMVITDFEGQGDILENSK